MKKLLLILLYIPMISLGQATFSNEIVISDNSTGYGRPRLAITANDIPIIIWYKEGVDHSLMMSRGNGNGTFSMPSELVDHDLEPTGFIGPEVAAKGDTVYIVFICGVANNSIMIKKSFDGGITFSDTIRVSTNDNNFKYSMPNIAVKENGNPVVTYMKCAQNYTNWQQIVNVSFDYGTSFNNEVNASYIAPGEPCDCCKSSVVCKGDNIYLLYRNNYNNVRNMYISKSIDGGITFTEIEDLDDLNWITNTCPTSSAYGAINGDSIFIIRRNGGNGIQQIYFSNVNLNDLKKEYFREVNPIGFGLQDKPSVAGRGSVLGAVWQDNRSGNNSCYFAYSLSGAHNLGNTLELSDSTAFGHKTHPDIEYSNGIFYFVYRYNTGNKIIYKELDISTLTAINENKEESKELINIIDLLGRTDKYNSNNILFYIYNNGTVEKKILLNKTKLK